MSTLADSLPPTIDALVRATLDFTCAARVANGAVSRVRAALDRRGLIALDDARTRECEEFLAALPAELREADRDCPRRRAVAELADALAALWAAQDAFDDALIAAAPMLDDPRDPLAARRTNQVRGAALRAAAPYAVARALPEPTGFLALRAIVADAPLEHAAAALADLDAARFELLAVRESQPAAPAKRPRRAWLGDALLLLKDNPAWSDRRIAAAVGVDRSALTRSVEYRRLRAAARQARPRGFRTADCAGRRGIEAIGED